MTRSVKIHGLRRGAFGCEAWPTIAGSLVLLVAATVVAGDDKQLSRADDSSTIPAPAALSPDGSVPNGRLNGSEPQKGSRGRVALADTADKTRGIKSLALVPSLSAAAPDSAVDASIARAIQTIADCQVRYQTVNDYVCTFYKRERVDGNLTPLHIMSMKVRTKPQSIYFKFQRPARGREAIYIVGKNDGKILAHDVGLNKFLAGTLAFEPTSARAMDENRHPITEAGIGPLIDTLARRWSVELNPKDSRLSFQEDMRVGSRPCLLIESIHPHRNPQFLFHKVRVFIDKDLGLPIRFEAYDWPRLPHAEPELAEEYTYGDVKLNVGLQEIDFDAANKEYAFGRF